MNQNNELEIIEAIKSGNDAKVFDELYNQTFAKIKSYILKNGGQVQDAQDVFQDGVLAFYRLVASKKYKHNTQIDAYVFIVARNSWFAKIKKNKQNVDVDGLIIEDNQEESPLNKLLKTEKEELVKNALEQIGDRCKTLLINIIFYDMSLKEIVEKMGFSTVNAAKTKNYKCKQRLMKVIRENDRFKSLI